MTQPTNTNVAERATLEAALAEARRAYHFSRTKENEARKDAAMAALVAFNLRTIRMVPVTHVRR